MRLKCGHLPLLYEGAALLGRSLYLLKLGRVRRVRWRGQIVWLKRRHFYAPLIILCGNAFSRLFNCGVYGLAHLEWLRWEETLSPLCGDGQTRRGGRNLLSPPMQGLPLRGLLREEKARDAFSLALYELHRLHQSEVQFPCGTVALWSHGDAHAGNVFVDGQKGRARWFDFESVHDLRRSSDWRHADDLQTLLFSSAVYGSEVYWPDMIHLAREIYDDKNVWHELQCKVRRLELWPNVVQLGHAHLPRAAHERLTKLLKATCETKQESQEELWHRKAFD